MKTLDIAQGTEALSKHARQEKEPVLVTDQSRPLFVLVPAVGADLETVSLALSPQFQAFRQRSLAECPPGQGVSADEVRRRFGIEDKAARKAG